MYPCDNQIPVMKLRNDSQQRRLLERRVEPFIKGPIPVRWASAAARLQGKTLQVALALLWISGMQPGNPIKITRRALELFGVSDDAYRDALVRMADSGLIEVSPRPGQRSLVRMVGAR